jgi:hypothetical protein
MKGANKLTTYLLETSKSARAHTSKPVFKYKFYTDWHF